jgi:hypothetical protein
MQELLLQNKQQVRPQVHYHQAPRSRSSMGSNAIVQAKLVGGAPYSTCCFHFFSISIHAASMLGSSAGASRGPRHREDEHSRPIRQRPVLRVPGTDVSLYLFWCVCVCVCFILQSSDDAMTVIPVLVVFKSRVQ